MPRITNILLRARDSLVDHDKQRWSNDQLLRLLDDAQKDIARHSKLLKETTELALVEGVSDYILPDDLWLITRASSADADISLLTYDQMDEQVKKERLSDTTQFERTRGYNGSELYGSTISWQTDEGPEISALIYDNRNIQSIRVYPIPTPSILSNLYPFTNTGYLETTSYPTDSAFGLLADVDEPDAVIDELGIVVSADAITYLNSGVESIDEVGVNSPFGFFSELQDFVQSIGYYGDSQLGFAEGIDGYTADSPFGTLTALFDPEIDFESFNSVLGATVSINESKEVLKIWYIKLPKQLETEFDELEIPPMFDTAMRLHLVGNAFLNDNDAASQQKGRDALALYDRELNLAKETEHKSGVRNPANLTTTYRGPFE